MIGMQIHFPSAERRNVMFSSLLVCMSVSDITKKRVKGFSWNFQDISDMAHGTHWNILRIICFISWVQDFSYFFCSGVGVGRSGSISKITKIMSVDFHEIFRTGRPWHQAVGACSGSRSGYRILKIFFLWKGVGVREQHQKNKITDFLEIFSIGRIRFVGVGVGMGLGVCGRFGGLGC